MYNLSDEERISGYRYLCPRHTVGILSTNVSKFNPLYYFTLSFQIVARKAGALQGKFLIFILIHEVCHFST